MSTLVVLFIFCLSLYITWTRGLAAAFALVYLPVLVLLHSASPVKLPLLPDFFSTFAVGYGIIGGLFLRHGFVFRLNFKWSLLDTMIVALWIVATFAAYGSLGATAARNTLGDWFFDYVTPYFFARAAFKDPEGRRLALWSASACAVLIALMSPIEMRLRPQLFSRILDQLGLYVAPNATPLYRLGFARAQTTFMQTMDQGNGGVLLAALIGIFAATTRVGLRDYRVLIALGAAFFVSAASLSFSAAVNIVGSLAIFSALWSMKWTGRLLPLAPFALVIGGVIVTSTLINRPLGERGEKLGQDLNDSLHMRTLIVQNSWPFARDAGMWGYGKGNVTKEMIALESVDNTYLLFTMERGWPFLVLFCLIPFAMTWRATRVWNYATLDSQRLPIAIGISVFLSIMIAMYAIFFGFVFAKLWLILCGVLVSTMDALETPHAALATRRGFEPTVYGPPAMAMHARGL